MYLNSGKHDFLWSNEGHTVDGLEYGVHQLRLVVYPVYLQGFVKVMQDFFHQQYVNYRQVIANILSIIDASFNCGDASDMDHLLGDSWNGETENCFMPTASCFAVSLKIDGSESPQMETTTSD